jgi:hypothetical protein
MTGMFTNKRSVSRVETELIPRLRRPPSFDIETRGHYDAEYSRTMV